MPGCHSVRASRHHDDNDNDDDDDDDDDDNDDDDDDDEGVTGTDPANTIMETVLMV